MSPGCFVRTSIRLFEDRTVPGGSGSRASTHTPTGERSCGCVRICDFPRVFNGVGAFAERRRGDFRALWQRGSILPIRVARRARRAYSAPTGPAAALAANNNRRGTSVRTRECHVATRIARELNVSMRLARREFPPRTLRKKN